MARYVAFLRAINVGGRVVKMERLRQIFEDLGLTSVETFIASGNVVFNSRASASTLERKIENQLQVALGYEVATFVRSDAEVGTIADYPAFPPPKLHAPEAKLFIGFLSRALDAKTQAKLLSFSTDTDEFHFNERELYWLCRGRLSDSKFSGALLEKTLGLRATVRNANTIRRLALKYPAID
ncbi:MAG: DUF1697 domain-containing protein [Chthoniobacterales bacterium]